MGRKEEARDKLLPGNGEGDRRAQFGGGAAPLRQPCGPPLPCRGGLIIANLDEADLAQFDCLVVTPGLPLNRHPIAQRAREAGVEIIGDIELFARARPELPPHKVVGITGTNGKSTTTALVHHILKTAGVPTTMGGNIGLPILAQDPLPEGGVYVLELSSYQIDLTQSLDCDVAVLLNITPGPSRPVRELRGLCGVEKRDCLRCSRDWLSSTSMIVAPELREWIRETSVDRGGSWRHGRCGSAQLIPITREDGLAATRMARTSRAAQCPKCRALLLRWDLAST